MEKNPYSIIKFRYITEKTSVLANLEKAESNKCLKKYSKPKVVFLVAKDATKQEIAWAFEKIYQRKNIKVAYVNTIIKKPKPRRLRGRPGKTNCIKKAIITLEEGNSIDQQL